MSSPSAKRGGMSRQRLFDVFAQLFVVFFIEVFGKFGHHDERERADERSGDGEDGHAHAHGDADLAHRALLREPRGDQAGGQEKGDGGVDERVGGAHARDGERGGEEGAELLARVAKPAALDKEVGDRKGEGYEIGKDDGQRDAPGAVEQVAHVRHEQNARADHAQFFDEVDDAVRDKALVPPKFAAEDGVDGVERQARQQDEQDGHAARVGE